MRTEAMLERLRNGGKLRRPAMGDAYLVMANVAEDGRNPVFKPRIILITATRNQLTFLMTNEDLLAEDWEEAEPIVPVNMYASAFKIRCPKCNREYQAGEKWELRVGDLYNCTCGNKLLLKPPEFAEAKPAATPVPGCKFMSDKVEEPQVRTIEKWPMV